MENREKDIVAADVTDIALTSAGYYWWAGYNEFEFTCNIKGEDDVITMTEYRQDDGSGITIRSEKDDIWERITPSEVWKLEGKLQEAIAYGNFHKRIESVTTKAECDITRYMIIENDNIHLRRVSPKLFEELSAKEKRIEKKEKPSVREKLKNLKNKLPKQSKSKAKTQSR